MNLTAVESTVLSAIGYDERLGVLRLKFRSRAVYDYFGVPVAINDALLRAPSVGACFNEVVRGYFPFCRVPATEAECRPGEEL